MHFYFHFTFNFISCNQLCSRQSHHWLIMLKKLVHMTLFQDVHWAGLTHSSLYPELEPVNICDRQLHGILLYWSDTRAVSNMVWIDFLLLAPR